MQVCLGPYRPSRCDARHRTYRHGARYASQQTWTMTAGAIALAIYSFFVCRLLVRAHVRAMPATLLLFVVWLVVAFGLLGVAGGQT